MQATHSTTGNQGLVVSAREWDESCRLYQSMCWYPQPQQVVFSYDVNAAMPFIPPSVNYPHKGALLEADVKA